MMIITLRNSKQILTIAQHSMTMAVTAKATKTTLTMTGQNTTKAKTIDKMKILIILKKKHQKKNLYTNLLMSK